VWKEEYTCILFHHPSTVSTVSPIFCTLSTLPCPPFFLVLFWPEVSFQKTTFSENKKFQVEEGYLTPWHSDSVEGKAEYLSRLDKLWVISNHNRSVQGYRYRDTGSNHNRSVQGYHISSPVSLVSPGRRPTSRPVFPSKITHERLGSTSKPILNGHLYYPRTDDIDRRLHTVFVYIDYNNRPSNSISFIPDVGRTSDRLHCDLVCVSFL
jgi:hypothetical protein